MSRWRDHATHTLLVLAALGVGTWATSRGRADAPAGRYLVAAESVQDTATGLTWQRAPSGSTLAQGAAATYCAALDPGGQPWRLPTITELESIVDPGRYNWALDATAFPRPASPLEDRFWTSTPAASDAASAWAIDFYHGNSKTERTSGTFYVRCVR